MSAGAGARLRPLTTLLPKPLCPVANRPLLDWALERLGPLVGACAVNVHHRHGGDAIAAHLAGRGVHVSFEEIPLGTAGAFGALAGWLDGRGALILNADAWSEAPLAPLLAGWDGDTVRVLVAGGPEFGPRSEIAASLLPWREIARLPAAPLGLYEAVWRRTAAEGTLEVRVADGPVIDAGSPAGYLRANLAALAGASLVAEGAVVRAPLEEAAIGAGAEIDAPLRRVVVWPHTRVPPATPLQDAIAAPGLTVLVR
ncbi:MAG: NDP-sugar synthase [Acidimicrobiales bacterium]